METIYGSTNNKNIGYVLWGKADPFEFEVSLFWQIKEERFVVKKRIGNINLRKHMTNQSTPYNTIEEAMNGIISFMNQYHSPYNSKFDILHEILKVSNTSDFTSFPNKEIQATVKILIKNLKR